MDGDGLHCKSKDVQTAVQGDMKKREWSCAEKKGRADVWSWRN